MNGFSSFLFLSDVNTESESENMINLLFVLRIDVERKVNGTHLQGMSSDSFGVILMAECLKRWTAECYLY